MSYQIPSMRSRRSERHWHGREAFTAPAPLTAPEIIAAAREAVCEFCSNNSAGNCRLFGCCQKSISETVKLALQQCPAGHWKRWLPTPLKP